MYIKINVFIIVYFYMLQQSYKYIYIYEDNSIHGNIYLEKFYNQKSEELLHPLSHVTKNLQEIALCAKQHSAEPFFCQK